MNADQRLAREFVRLHQKQLESMETATFLGLTPEGWREYDAREFCIRVLTHELQRLTSEVALRATAHDTPQKSWPT